MNENDLIVDAKILASIMTKSRYEAGASQEFMAMGLSVSKNTIYNWEKGTSQPSIKQFVSWFKLLGLNPTPYIIQYCNSEEAYGINANSSDSKIEESLNKVIETLTIEEKRQLLYLLWGSHGSDPKAFLQMITADLHTPMSCRVNVARTIIDNYEICEKTGKLVDVDHILPDMQKLKEAVELGKEAAINGDSGYSFVNSSIK